MYRSLLLAALLLTSEAWAEGGGYYTFPSGAISTNSCATDNALITSNGTGGASLQCNSTGITVSDAGLFSLDENYDLDARGFEIQDNNVDRFVFSPSLTAGGRVRFGMYDQTGVLTMYFDSLSGAGEINSDTGKALSINAGSSSDLTLTAGDDIFIGTASSVDEVNILGQDPVLHLHNTVTLAEANAGKTLLAGVAGRILRVTYFVARVSGAWATCTSVDLESTNATPVAVQTAAVAALTDGAVLKDGTANVTRGVGMWGDLGTGDGIAVTVTGSACTGGTDITYDIQYTVD